MNELSLLKPWHWKIIPNCRVKAFDSRKYIDDIKTPLAKTMRLATVIRRYGYRSQYNTNWIYPDICDVKFDGEDEICEGKFTYGLAPIDRIFN